MTKFSNLFSLFALVATRLLSPGGRMVFITPTELFTTNYGKRALQQLPSDVRLTNVVVFEPEAEPFDDALTTACITTFERGDGSNEVQVERVHGRNAQGTWDTVVEHCAPFHTIRDDPKRVVNGHAIRCHTALAGSCELGELVRVSRGIATGANAFFVVDASVRRAIDPDARFTVPVIWKAEDVGEGLAFDGHQLSRIEGSGRRCWLLNLTGREAGLPAPLRAYLEQGEQEGVYQRYLCKARRPWYAMEGQQPPLAFVGVFGRQGVRVALNAVGARTLACCHRLYHHAQPRLDEDGLLLLVCFLRSKLGAEALASQSRRYGRGLMKLEPKDLERILVPDLRRIPRQTVRALAAQVRTDLAAQRQLSEVCQSVSVALAGCVAAISANTPTQRGQLQLPGLNQ